MDGYEQAISNGLKCYRVMPNTNCIAYCTIIRGGSINQGALNKFKQQSQLVSVDARD